MQAFVFKTKTFNGRIVKTTVFMPENNIVVINRLLLAKEKDIEDGCFENYKRIYTRKDNVLMREETVFWVESFLMIMEAFRRLSEKIQRQDAVDTMG